jgi:hypothetical protein
MIADLIMMIRVRSTDGDACLKSDTCQQLMVHDAPASACTAAAAHHRQTLRVALQRHAIHNLLAA